MTFALGIFLSYGFAALAAPPGYDVTTTTFADPFRGAAALAYAPDGTLYVVEGVDFLSGPNTTSIRVFAPNGAPLPSLSVTGDVPFISPSGAAVDLAGNLLITDNQANTMYSVNTTTGIQTSFAFTLSDIDDVAVRPGTGEVFVSDAAGFGGGGVYQVDGPADATPTPVVTGLDFAAGLDFDPAGNLIYQNAFLSSPFLTEGEVFRLDITETGSGLSFGGSTLLATGLIAQSDLAVDGEGDIFVSGGDFSAVGGLFELDRDGLGNFLGTATPFESATPDAFGGLFSTEVDFLIGSSFFEPDAGPDGGVLSFLSQFQAPTVINITPSGSASVVPEPTSLAAMLICAIAALAGYRLTRRSSRQVV